MLKHSITELVGNTPIMELSNFVKSENIQGRIYAKLEFLNPAGSIKDRIAMAMIFDAEEKGILKVGGTIIEPTSGNTGIGLAMLGTNRGYNVIIVMPDTMSKERISLIELYGAQVVLTAGKLGMDGAIKKAKELAEVLPNAIIAGQFSNMVNPQTHYQTTGKEIWQDLNGQIDVLIAGVGTGGTISGIGQYLKEKNPKIKVIAVEPAKSPILSKGYSGSHNIQGIGAGFIPKTLNQNIYDEVLQVSDEDALAYAKKITKLEGLFVGISAGAALVAAKDYALKCPNKNIVVILPDSGDRYLSVLN